MIDVCELVDVGYSLTPGGNQQERIVRKRRVYCSVQSIGVKELYAAMAVEHNPELKIILRNADDYQNEHYAVYHDAVYVILRTYRTGFGIELTLERTRDLEGMI